MTTMTTTMTTTIRFDTQALMPRLACDDYCSHDCGCSELECYEYTEVGQQNLNCGCEPGCGCPCSCDPNFDATKFKLEMLADMLGQPQGEAWDLADDGTLDTVVIVAPGYEISDDGTLFKIDDYECPICGAPRDGIFYECDWHHSED